MHPSRPYPISADGSLDRRHLEEDYLFFAQIMNNLKADNIALKTITRQKLSLDSSEEMFWSRSFIHSSEPHPFNKNEIYDNPDVVIPAGPSGEFWIDWNINIVDNYVATSVNQYLRIVPFADGRLLWRAGDLIQNDWPASLSGGGEWIRAAITEIPVDDDSGNPAAASAHSLGGQCHFASSSCTFDVGLIAACLSVNIGGDHSEWSTSRYSGLAGQIVVRRSLR